MKTRQVRSYKLDGIYSPGCYVSIESALSSLRGIEQIQFDRDRRTVKLTYDLMHVTSQQIEDMLEMTGYPVVGSPWQKIKLGLIHYNEENIRDNLRAKPADCCSNPRSITQK